jgi:hypothetical protein
MNHRFDFIAAVSAVCLFGALCACPAAEDAYAGLLKTHYPYGVHKLRTQTNDASIVWQSETLDNNQVKRETQTFSTLNDFRSNLVIKALDKSAYIEIAGMWDHASAPDTDAKQNEALLKTLRDLGYEEAHFANLKRHYGPEGHHFIDTNRADGKIAWTSSVIQGNRKVVTKREYASLEDFKAGFLAAKLGKATSIEVHCRPVKIEGATARSTAIVEFLHQQGYDKAGGISN